CSIPWRRTTRWRRRAKGHFCKACNNPAGPSGAMCKSRPAGRPAIPTVCANTRWNWSRSRRMSSWPVATRLRRPSCKPPVPIVFVIAPDPVGAGFVDSLPQPGGNATGFLAFEYGLSGKWLELLKDIAPGVTRVAVLRDPALASGPGQFAAIQSMAPSLGAEVSPVNVRNAPESERSVAAFARSTRGGLIVTGSALVAVHRHLIIALAARHKLPAVYVERSFAAAGGLISYGPDFLDQYRRAAGYVDRILRGEKP